MFDINDIIIKKQCKKVIINRLWKRDFNKKLKIYKLNAKFI